MESEESLEESREEVGEEESGGREDGARLAVTQSDDPRSGGHFAVGMSKPPLNGEARTLQGVGDHRSEWGNGGEHQ